MSSSLPIYMDHHATTPVDDRVLQAMLPYFAQQFGNPASVTHAYGWAAQDAVEQSRQRIAQAINAEPKEIIFTSGATESDNLAIKGVARALREKGNHIIISAIEHNAVLDCARALDAEGFTATIVGVGPGGIVNPDDVRSAITDKTILVSIMTANNEIGTIQPIREIGRIVRAREIYFHTDAAQATGYLPVDVEEDCIDLMSISAHKMYGPKGIGALYVRRKCPRVKLQPIIHGGGHEKGLRSGTLPVPLIIGFAEAFAIAKEVMPAENARLADLRDRLLGAITSKLDCVRVNGSLDYRLPHNLNLSFEGINAEAVLTAIPEVALSSGSACTAAEVSPSHVLKAIGLSDEQASGSIRFGLGRCNTNEEVEYVAKRVVDTVTDQRELNKSRPARAS